MATKEYSNNYSITTINKEEVQHKVLEEIQDRGIVKMKPMPWVAKTIQKKLGMKIWKGKKKQKVDVVDTLPPEAVILDTLTKFTDLNI
tara:strand:- start:348 stop:611 length:264 start_codon:yes stop_codon:yes gene_type:complete